MKKQTVKLMTAFAAAALFTFAGCKKDSGEKTLSDEEMVELVTEAVVPESSGLALQASSAVSLSAKPAACSLTKDSTLAATYSSASRSYSYSLNWHYATACTLGVVQSIAGTLSGGSTYSGPYTSSVDQSSGTFSLAGLNPLATEYSFTIDATRTGTQNFNIGRVNAIKTVITLSGTNIKISKTTNQISSGTANLNLAGTSNGSTFTGSAVVTFKGSKTADVELGSGKKFSISW